MKIVLTKDVDKLGRIGDTKEVADGFASHWLFPQGLAVGATTSRARLLRQRREYWDAKAQAAEQAPQPAIISKSATRKQLTKARDSKKIARLKTK